MEEEIAKLKNQLKERQDYYLAVMEYITDNLVAMRSLTPEENRSSALYGRKCAFVEIMECLMAWKGAKKFGYDWDVEEEFPL